MEDRDRRRWQTADENSDGTLNKLEFKHFLHPEESDHMRDIVISETIADIDKDGDGLISLVGDHDFYYLPVRSHLIITLDYLIRGLYILFFFENFKPD